MPKYINTEKLRTDEKENRERQQFYYNKHHRARDLSIIKEGNPVWVTDQRTYGQVIQKLPEPRSYLIKTPKGTIRRNRMSLIPSKNKQLILYL